SNPRGPTRRFVGGAWQWPVFWKTERSRWASLNCEKPAGFLMELSCCAGAGEVTVCHSPGKRCRAEAPRSGEPAMSKKKSSPKQAAKARSTSAKQCAKGGPHEWEQEDGGTFCKKCHEAKPTKAKKGTKPAKAK